MSFQVSPGHGGYANMDILQTRMNFLLKTCKRRFYVFYIRLQWMWSRYEGESEYLPVCVCVFISRVWIVEWDTRPGPCYQWAIC